MLLSFIMCQFTDQSRQNYFPSFTFPFSLILSRVPNLFLYLLPWLRQPGSVGSVVHHTLIFDMLDALHAVPVVPKNLNLPYLNLPYLNLPNLPRPRNLIQVPSRLDLPGTVSVVVSHLR